MSTGDAQKQVKLPLARKQMGKVLKTWQSGTQLTHPHPDSEGQAIVLVVIVGWCVEDSKCSLF